MSAINASFLPADIYTLYATKHQPHRHAYRATVSAAGDRSNKPTLCFAICATQPLSFILALRSTDRSTFEPALQSTESYAKYRAIFCAVFAAFRIADFDSINAAFGRAIV